MIYRAVGFDWGGVINGKPGKFFGQNAADLLGISYEKYLKAYYNHNKKFNRGEITAQELWILVLSELGQPEKAEQIMALSQQLNAENINQKIFELVDRLRKSGLKVGLLSNNSIEKAKRMREIGLDKHFDVFHISAETGFVKPEPEAFKHLASELDVRLEELIFIDDSEKSLSTATECGFAPILFEDYKKLTHKLTGLGIRL